MRKRKGFIIIMALLITASLSLMIGAFSLSVFYRNQMAVRQINSVKAYYLALAGIEYGRRQIFEYYDGFKPSANYSFSLANTGDEVVVDRILPAGFTLNSKERYFITIRSTADINGVIRVLECQEESSYSLRKDFYTFHLTNTVRRTKNPVIKWQ